MQWVNRPDLGLPRLRRARSSAARCGPATAIACCPSGRETHRRAHRHRTTATSTQAVAGQAVTLTLADEIDVSRGDVLADADAPPQRRRPVRGDGRLDGRGADAARPHLPDALGTAAPSRATIAPLKYKLNVDTLEHVAATHARAQRDRRLRRSSSTEPIAFDPYTENRDTGGFILIDRITNDTVGAGPDPLRAAPLAQRPLAGARRRQGSARRRRRASSRASSGSPACRAPASRRSPTSSSRSCTRRGCHTYLLDGDNVRHGLNKDLGFTDADRVENIRRVAEVARLMVDAGLIVLVVVHLAVPRASAAWRATLLGEGEFVEVFVDTPLDVAEERDPKGLYKKARRGELQNFTGIDSPYERPESPELRLDTTAMTAEEAADAVIALLSGSGRPQ